MQTTPMLSLFAALALAACAAPTPPGERRVRYACANDQPVEMQFFAQRNLAVLTRNGQAIELPQQPAASGFVYSNGPNTVRGQGDELILEIGRMVPIRCKAT